MAMEQDHRHLNNVVESKIAVDAELSDLRENERLEDYFAIAGLKRIDPKIVGKPWQDLAVKHVQAALTALMGRQYNIIVVHPQLHPPCSRCRGYLYSSIEQG